MIITQARMGSTRFAGKVFKEVGERKLLDFHIERLRKVRFADEIVIAIPEHQQDDAIEHYAREKSVSIFRGDEKDVLSRYYLAAKSIGAQHILRVTSDCPLIDPGILDQMIQFSKTQSDYDLIMSNRLGFLPHGLDAELFSAASLERAHRASTEPSEREHVSEYFLNRQEESKILDLPIAQREEKRSHRYRWTVDYPEDLAFIQALYKKMGEHLMNADWLEILAVLELYPELKKINEVHCHS